jgi:hypothetical protein
MAEKITFFIIVAFVSNDAAKLFYFAQPLFVSIILQDE